MRGAEAPHLRKDARRGLSFRTVPCRYWIAGHCRNGNKCDFYHARDKGRCWSEIAAWLERRGLRGSVPHRRAAIKAAGESRRQKCVRGTPQKRQNGLNRQL
jgi:hypothetical protein